jgi:hypothetical protein
MSVSQTLILPFICLRTNVLGRLVAAATYLHCVTVSVDRHGDLSRQASVRSARLRPLRRRLRGKVS